MGFDWREFGKTAGSIIGGSLAVAFLVWLLSALFGVMDSLAARIH